MFDRTSRYQGLETATFTDAEGREIVYVKRRFLPRGSRLPLLMQVQVDEGDRLDRIAARTLGNAELFWRIADATDAMDPADLEVVETVLRVPIPGAGEGG
jgi:nucleoid-associated protein YgaU